MYGRSVLGRCSVDRGRKATKTSVLSDSLGAPLAVCYHVANKNECTPLANLLTHANAKLGPLSATHQMLLADKGSDTEARRNACIRHGLVPIVDRKRKRTLRGASSSSPT